MPVFFLIIACALWGLSFPLLKVLNLEQAARLPGASSLFLASWLQFARFGFATILVLPFVIRQKGLSRLEMRQGLILAFWGGLAMWLQADALAYTEASTSAFLTGAYCVFIPLWTSFRLRVHPGARVIVATLMVLIGGAVLSGIRPDHLGLGRGEVETLFAALLFAFQILTLENPKYATNRGLPVSFTMFLGITVLFIPITLSTAPGLQACLTPGASLAAVWLVSCLTIFCSVGAYLLMNTWQPRVSATEAGLIYTTEPAFTAVYVLFLPIILGKWVGLDYANEKASISMIVGGALILAANVIMQWKPRAAESSP
ncbi:MAG: DMT family transporter [Akkermansiaceae bacterium]|nr:DMT family transporter [Akkermansiaceae bacterium]